MKLQIRHETTYRYSQSVKLLPHQMILRPRNTQDIALIAASLECLPHAEIDWSQDVFGNLIALGTFAETASELTIKNSLTVVQSAIAWPVFKISPDAHSYPFDYSAGDIADLGALRTPVYPDPESELRNWACGFIGNTPTDTLSLLKDLNAGMLDRLSYRKRDEEGTQTPLETLQLESGSCRDIAALFIEAARHLGFGARAVSGYFFDPQPLPDDPGSTHAWADIYLPGAGWIAFDPTNRRVGGEGLVPIAASRSISQIMPIAGGYLGAPADFLGMEVLVTITRDD